MQKRQEETEIRRDNPCKCDPPKNHRRTEKDKTEKDDSNKTESPGPPWTRKRGFLLEGGSSRLLETQGGSRWPAYIWNIFYKKL